MHTPSSADCVQCQRACVSRAYFSRKVLQDLVHLVARVLVEEVSELLLPLHAVIRERVLEGREVRLDEVNDDLGLLVLLRYAMSSYAVFNIDSYAVVIESCHIIAYSVDEYMTDQSASRQLLQINAPGSRAAPPCSAGCPGRRWSGTARSSCSAG